MAESIVADLAAGLIGKLASLAAQEVIQAWNLEKDLDTLGERFTAIVALSDDALTKNITMASVKIWFDKLEDVANDTEAFMDEISYQVTRRHVEEGRRKVWDCFIPSKNNLIYRFKVARKIKSIHASFDHLHKLSGDLGLRPVQQLNLTVQPRDICYQPLYEDTTLIVGRKRDLSHLVQTVCNNNEHDLHVVAIKGMGGQGKTTLASMVFNSDDVSKMFTKKMWVTVSDDFKIINILNEMVESLTSKESRLQNLQGLVNKLQDSIKGEKFLLVLDDVWNEESVKWENLRKSLLGVGGAKGSSVIVTTRKQEVIDAMRNCDCHQVEKLPEDDSYELFKKIAFGDGGVSETEPFTDMGRSMVRRCGGLPLAIKALGGLLRSKESEQEWRKIENSEIWTSQDVLSSLRLSYDNLPYSSLKRCFVYFSIIPKDTRIYKDKLIQIWMALGFLLPPLGSVARMEDIGSEFFNILLWHSLLQDIERDKFGNINSCKMHDLVHDLALDLSNKNSVSVKTGHELNHVSKATYLRLDTRVSDRNPTNLKRDFKKVRLLYARAFVFRDVLPYIPHLTVLVLNTDGVRNAGELPKSLRNMKYLKHLDISCLSGKLPIYITEFYNLQTLRAGYLLELPKKFCNLINLRHFYINTHRSKCVLNGIERLTCLQTLPDFVVSKNQNCLLEQLEGLHNLRGKVKLYGLNDVANMQEACKAKLCTKSNIESLFLHWDTNQDGVDIAYNNESTIEGLEPHINLKELKISYFMGKRFGSWITKMSNLMKIRLSDCGRCEEFPSLGDLPKLREMELVRMDNVRIIRSKCGAAGNVTTMYPSLTRLKLWNLPKLEEWLEAGGDQSSVQVFSKLEDLTIYSCPKLTRLADSSFPSLKKLTIRDSDKILEQMSTKVSCLQTKNGHMIEGGEGTSLSRLDLDHCPGLTCLRVDVTLDQLSVFNCPDLTSILAVREGGCLRDLEIKGCPSLSVFDRSAISTIERLTLNEIPGAFTSSVISFPNLTHLTLWGYNNPVKSTLEFDDGHVSAFSVLTRLEISGFKGLKTLPNTIAKLPCLEELYILHCEELESLPIFDPSHSIRRLYIRGCDILKEICKENGPEWYKIQHISIIELEGSL